MGKKIDIDYARLIVPTTVKNNIIIKDDFAHVKGREYSDASFDTRDFVFIRQDIRPLIVTQCHPSDYAMMCGADISNFRTGFRYLVVGSEVLRAPAIDSCGNRRIKVFDSRCMDTLWTKNVYPSDKDYCVRPCMNLDLEYFEELFNIEENPMNFGSVFDDSFEIRYKVVELGEYPQGNVDLATFRKLETALRDGHSVLCDTGCRYLGYKSSVLRDMLYKNPEFMDLSDFNKYVKTKCVSTDLDKYIYHTMPSEGSGGFTRWTKVEPIRWIILNWSQLPKSINPRGDGTAKIVEVMSEDGIISGLPFYSSIIEDNRDLWQNSSIRGYLNGINVNNIIDNGNPEYSAPNGGDFSDRCNFLTLAFGLDPLEMRIQHRFDDSVVESKVPEVISMGSEDQSGEIITENPYDISVEDVPMSVDEQIRFYVDNGMSFMLHGPSGVGKSRRIEEIDPDFVSIVLRNGILPEEIIGKTIYSSYESLTGRWMPPAWYDELCEKCKDEPDKKHILFIDEITNVKPSEQSLVYHIVLNNSIGPNLGKLPENVVVASAGNAKDESESAYVMPEPLFRRFDGHIYLKPDIQQFIEWGSEKSNKGENRYKIHPFISAFVGMNAEKVFYSKYDNDNPPKYAIDPRGWEQISDIIYDNDGVICQELIENKAGGEITASLMEFARKPLITLSDVLNGNYNANDIPRSFDGKYALAVGLRGVDEGRISIVRDFINMYLGDEILAMFDSLWIGNSDERALLIDGLNLTNDSGRYE